MHEGGGQCRTERVMGVEKFQINNNFIASAFLSIMSEFNPVTVVKYLAKDVSLTQSDTYFLPLEKHTRQSLSALLV